MDEELLEKAFKAAKDARRAAVMTGLAVLIAVVVLAIDNGIKRSIVEKGEEALRLYKATRDLVGGDQDGGAEAAGETGTPSGAALNGDHGVVHDAAAGEVLGEAGGPAENAPVPRPARPQRRPSGNGGRATRK